MFRLAVCLAALCLPRNPPAFAGDSIELRDGEKVVLLGSALVEQEQLYGYWETLLTAAYPDRRVTFRNLGWSGDTVWGESRGMFEPHLGYERLIAHVQHEQPTLILIAYGNTAAFGGEVRLEAFEEQLLRLIGDLSAADRRLVFISPLLMEASQLPIAPEEAQSHAQKYNRDVVRYSEVIRRAARNGRHAYIDLQSMQLKTSETGAPPLTDNGTRLADPGYRQTARWLASNLSPGGNVDHLEAVVELDFESPPAAALREAILSKNQLYFHRWRPQNFTYLFGFRKHEQGNNSVEIPQFDPLVAAAEEDIARRVQAVTTGNRNLTD
jgi:GDSL-like Lipase/Acylhydrolase family